MCAYGAEAAASSREHTGWVPQAILGAVGPLLQGLHRLGIIAEKLLIEAYADPVCGIVADGELAEMPDLSPAGVGFVVGRMHDIDPRFRMSLGRLLASHLAEQPRIPMALRARLPDLLAHDDFYIRLPVAKMLARAFWREAAG